MENNYNGQNMATASQLNYLKRLGYAGSDNITAMQANDLIKKLTAGNQQPQNNYGGYQTPTPQQNQAPVKVQNQNSVVVTRSGDEITITPQTVHDYLGVELTQPEFNYFFSVCNLYGLNPFIKDIYPIKFGTQPATFVIDYKVMQQAADEEPSFDGLKVGIIYLDKNGQPQEREGAYLLPNEQLIGAWCDVYRKDRGHCNRTYALYDENAKKTKEGKITAQWAEKPVFMITKVAKAQALRETFPNMFSNNTYTSEEIENDNKETKYSAEEIIDAQYEETGSIKPNIPEEKPTPQSIIEKNLGVKQEQPKNLFNEDVDI